MAAFRRAWGLGCEAVELDVHVSADGHAVVIHDQDLSRTAGLARAVADCSLAELQTFDIGSWKHAEFASERIATLTDVLDDAPGGATVFVEVKAAPRAIDHVVAALRKTRSSAREVTVALQSFDIGVLTAMIEALPGISAYWTVGPMRRADKSIAPYPHVIVERAAALGLAGIALDARAVDDLVLETARIAGVLVDVWTVNDAEALRAWCSRPLESVRWIETDRPELLGA
jgi:glycerophosphoryl diester phosphodiesterase